MSVELKKCPYCKRPAELKIDKEISDTSKLHTIRCSYSHCLSIQESLSGWQPDYKNKVEQMKNDWNTIVSALEDKE